MLRYIETKYHMLDQHHNVWSVLGFNPTLTWLQLYITPPPEKVTINSTFWSIEPINQKGDKN